MDTENQDLQPDKEDSDCMFVERWRNRKPQICQVQGGEPEFWDDLSGKPLDTEMVLKAREDEMGEFAKHGVYEKVPVSECWNSTGKPPIGTRWVDVNKGDDQNPDYRSRLVAPGNK